MKNDNTVVRLAKHIFIDHVVAGRSMWQLSRAEIFQSAHNLDYSISEEELDDVYLALSVLHNSRVSFEHGESGKNVGPWPAHSEEAAFYFQRQRLWLPHWDCPCS